jgi:hypothetical protein
MRWIDKHKSFWNVKEVHIPKEHLRKAAEGNRHFLNNVKHENAEMVERFKRRR